VESLVRKARDAGVAVEFGVHGQPEPLPAAVELSVFRVAQEGLTNAMKHAPSAVVRLEVRYQGHGVEVEVVNDGGPIQAGSNGGYGLIGLGERVAIFGGSLDVGPRPEGGWRLLATLPVAR
jgi:signal transduction histidine kinase